jgi:hypothetical protein
MKKEVKIVDKKRREKKCKKESLFEEFVKCEKKEISMKRLKECIERWKQTDRYKRWIECRKK